MKNGSCQKNAGNGSYGFYVMSAKSFLQKTINICHGMAGAAYARTRQSIAQVRVQAWSCGSTKSLIEKDSKKIWKNYVRRSNSGFMAINVKEPEVVEKRE